MLRDPAYPASRVSYFFLFDLNLVGIDPLMLTPVSYALVDLKLAAGCSFFFSLASCVFFFSHRFAFLFWTPRGNLVLAGRASYRN